MLLRPRNALAWNSIVSTPPVAIRSRAPRTLHTLRGDELQSSRRFLLRLPSKRVTTSQPYHGFQNLSHGDGTRLLSMSAIPAALLPPLAFVGLALTLWFYKCCMMVVFQNKIIYMPSIPPFSRGEKIEDYERACRPVSWEEKRIRSLDGTQLALAVGKLSHRTESGIDGQSGVEGEVRKHVVILYFQGNASSLPPRLPLLSEPLKALHGSGTHTDFTIIALSYRGYWTSRGRASQKGIELDALAALRWVQETYALNDPAHTRLVIWGQSIGAGVATGVLMQNISSISTTASSSPQRPVKVHGAILETPFVNTRRMLDALYPQKWLPYRYLWPFLRSWWDSEAALRAVAETRPGKELPILIISAAKDEIVPAEQANYLEKLAVQLGLDVSRRDVSGALHTEATSRAEGRGAVVEFLRKIADE